MTTTAVRPATEQPAADPQAGRSAEERAVLRAARRADHIASCLEADALRERVQRLYRRAA